MSDSENQNTSVLLPSTGGMFVLDKMRAPHRSQHPFELPNKPQLIDPMVNPMQICMLDRNNVIAQCNSPIDENDYHGWQRVVKFFRSVVDLVKPAQPQLYFSLNGDVLGEPSNVPTVGSDLNAWQKDMIQLRLRVGVMRLEKLL